MIIYDHAGKRQDLKIKSKGAMDELGMAKVHNFPISFFVNIKYQFQLFCFTIEVLSCAR